MGFIRFFVIPMVLQKTCILVIDMILFKHIDIVFLPFVTKGNVLY